ncbi:MAG: hypothetical protein M1830_004355 [Pleopsidium flavum]|nr:MAG: hypothetical protein M1830_004355 [Pleopsidium flavum]
MDKASSSSSKVTVEYYDPSAVFPLIAPGLHARLPLRNLHWNSPSRPLRSISSLHVDLVPNHDSQPSTTSPPSSSSGPNQTISTSNDSNARDSLKNIGSGAEQKRTVESGKHGATGSAKGRRHQIPGLRQTPYLKIYLLRCDDTETYKASSRKLLREWIKDHTPPAQSSTSGNAQENHDAFEWLIVHVVLPNTPAAAQPRWSAGGGGTSGADKAAGGSRFLGKSSSTIFEKISADFNGSSKTARDRVAQIRLQKDDLPSELQSKTSAATTLSYNEDQQDPRNAWEDMVSKMKSLILTSFDLRVTQYEEDIREKDSQRNLPGWNFCTFFVLKEGLARGFESVGLVEDALIGYDELALGLETVIRGRASGDPGEEHGETFLDHTKDLLQQAQVALSAPSGQNASGKEMLSEQPDGSAEGAFEEGPRRWPLDPNKKQYRELILANNVSVFDFQCYVFARQLSLLLRLGNGFSPDAGAIARPRSEPTYDQKNYASQADLQSKSFMHRNDELENLFALAEVCRRAVEFITSVARTMRSDLSKALEQGGKEAVNGVERGSGTHENLSVIVENMVSSWTYVVDQQILEKTGTVSIKLPPLSLPANEATGAPTIQSSGLDQAIRHRYGKPDSMPYPARTTSLPITLSSAVLPSKAENTVSESSYAHSEYRDSELNSSVPPTVVKAGTEELAACRAQLYLLARRILSHLGDKRGWIVDYTETTLLLGVNGADLEDVSLEKSDTKTLQSSSSQLPSLTTAGIQCTPLLSALQTKDAFYSLYESLTQDALKHFIAAKRSKSAQKCIADLAVLKFHLGDYATAASYFHQIAPFYAEGSWDLLEMSMLTLYAHCLKLSGQNDGYVRVILKIFAKRAAEIVGRSSFDNRSSSHTPEVESDQIPRKSDGPDMTGPGKLMADLVSYSAELQHEISVPMDRYASNISVNQQLRHFDDKDGFQLQLSFRCLLEDRISIQYARIKVSGTTDGQPKEIWLQNDESLTLELGLVRIWVTSNATIHGLYSVDKIVLQCQRINFVHDVQPHLNMAKPRNFGESSALNVKTSAEASHVFCYPRSSALEVRSALSRYIHLERSRCVEIEISSGENEILKGQLRIRSASAGLRLHIAEAMLVDGSVTTKESSRSGLIDFQRLSATSLARFRVPYAFDSELNELSLKIEVSYVTERGQFFYASNPSVSIALPLGVNVQDTFKEHALYSKFIISTVTSVPLRMVSSSLQASETFDTKPAGSTAAGLDIFRRQPASLIYRITRRKSPGSFATNGKKAQTSLSLSIDYRCVDEEISTLIERRFLKDIQESSFKDLSRLLLPTLLDRLRSKFTFNDLEQASLLHEVDLGPFEDMQWHLTLIWLPPAMREQVGRWLRKWHDSNRILPLNDIAGTSPGHQSNRQIVIPVEVPSISIVHTAHMRIVTKNSDGRSTDQFAAVGQIIAAALTIKHTRRWDTAKATEAPHNAEKPLNFSYEVQANPDLWLVAGRRRGHFSTKENEALTFPLMLLPQRPGYLLYPTVEIRAVPDGPDTLDGRFSSAEQGSRDSRDASSNDVFPTSCETDYRNQGDTILVLPNLKSSTVSLDPGGSAWLVESERRVEATMS